MHNAYYTAPSHGMMSIAGQRSYPDEEQKQSGWNHQCNAADLAHPLYRFSHSYQVRWTEVFWVQLMAVGRHLKEWLKNFTHYKIPSKTWLYHQHTDELQLLRKKGFFIMYWKKIIFNCWIVNCKQHHSLHLLCRGDDWQVWLAADTGKSESK